MKHSIQIKVLDEKETKIFRNYVTIVDAQKDITTSDFKALIKKEIKFLEPFQEVKEVLWCGNNKLNDDDVVPLKSGLEYNLIVK